MSSATREVKAGLFVFIALVLLAVMVFSISDFYTVQAQHTYPVRIRFNFVNGVAIGSPVRLSGVKVGEVRSVRVYRDEANQRTRVEIGVRISKDAVLEEDSVAYINTLGFLGEKYVEITPGTPGARVLAAEEILIGKDSIAMEKLVESGYDVIRQIEKSVASLNTILSDEQTRESLKETLINSRQASAHLNQLLAQANEVVGKVNRGEGTMGRLLMEESLYQDLKELTSDLRAHPWKLLYRPKEKKK